MTLRCFSRWTLGVLWGTTIIALTSPLFVRSYLPRQVDPVRQVLVLQPGQPYRWRSEGYATTWIGPHGMPGKQSLPPERSGTLQVAIWGDSQAEGVCVADTLKLPVQIEQAAAAQGQSLSALPFARSGDDASDWIAQIPRVETALQIDRHVVLIAQWEDLAAALLPPKVEPNPQLQSGLAARLPAFLIEAARRIVTDAEDQPRRLRFAPGPAFPPAVIAPANAVRTAQIDWGAVFGKLVETTRRPIIIVYAPLLPYNTTLGDRSEDPQEAVFRSVQAAAARHQIMLVDVRPAIRESAGQGRWPHGFHHGRFGSGHLNATGYQIIAGHVAVVLRATSR